MNTQTKILKKMKTPAKFLLTLMLITGSYAQAAVRYVTETGAGSKDGSSWTNASNDLQAMINASAANDQVWVATGTYKPTHRADNFDAVSTTDRYNAFVLKKDVQLYGGFSGNETALTARPKDNKSTLSGDIGVINDNSDNVYHVLISAGEVGTASVDGFIITKGNANGIYTDQMTINGYVIPGNSGGGIYNVSSSPFITNMVILNNTGDYGAGILNDGTTSTFSNVVIKDNVATYGGGGMRNHYNSTSSPTLINVLIAGNTASSGGGMQTLGNSSPVLINVTIVNNKATNSAGYEGGGGMCNSVVVRSGAKIPTPKLYNSIVYGNTASKTTTGNNNIVNEPELSYTCSPSYSYCLVGESGGSGNWDDNLGINVGNNIDADPLFVNTETGNYRLQVNSPCINAGDNSAIPADVTTDLSGNTRVVGAKVDMGAYEYNDAINSVNTVTADKDFVIYPNPVKDVINIYAKTNDNIKRVTVTNSRGMVVYNEQGDTDYWKVVVNNYPAGVYVVTAQNDLTTNTYKVIIK